MSDNFTYTVQDGDTVEDLSTRFYGVPAEYPKITNANPIIGKDLKIFPKQILSIPKKKVLNEQRTDEDEGDDTTLITIDGVRFENVWGFMLKLSISTAADEFSFQIPWNPADLEVRKSFIPFQYKPVKIFIGGSLQLTGTLINVVPAVSTDKRLLKISGYSKCGVLNDCMIPPKQEPGFKTSTFFNICKVLASYFNIEVFDAAGDNFSFEEVDIKRTDKIYKFLSRLAKKRGLLLTSDVEGNLIIQRTTDTKAEFTFKEGEPDILSISADYKGQEAYTSFTGVVDGKDVDELAGDDSATVIDDFIPQTAGARPFVFEVDEIDEGALEEATRAKLRRTWAKRITYSLVLKGWRDPKGNLWRDNKRLNVEYPSVMIFKPTEFLISSVQFEKDDSKRITKMNLVLPQAYNDEDLETVPWASE